MNKSRITKAITFFISGGVSFVSLIFLGDILALFFNEKTDLEGLKTLNLIHKFNR